MKMLVLVIFCGLFLAWGADSDSRDADPASIKKVHLIMMNHLDVGFDGIFPELGFVNNVINRYFTVYFPQAVQVGMELSMLGYVESLVYTTHPWLVSMYLDCPPDLVLAGVKLQCPNATEISNFKAAVKLGIITWHAGAMNMINEMFDPEMVAFSIKISQDLDKQFGIKRATRVLSQRDVPGMSAALLPIFAKSGITGISVGVNGVSSPPAVPKIFRWEYQNISLIAMWHPGGYPTSPGLFPSAPRGLSAGDCVTFQGFSEAMCFAFKQDNQGPAKSYQEVLLYHEIARGQFPNALIKASTFEDFVVSAESIKSRLPVIKQEIGNTWIQGSPSDPLKCSLMRGFMRARSRCLARDDCPADARLYSASRLLTKLGEHTWGINNAGDQLNWENDKFYKQLENKTATFLRGPMSWVEQREFNYLALKALQDHPLAEDVKAEWKQLQVGTIDLTDYETVGDKTALMSCNDGYHFQFGMDGSLIKLINKNGDTWADKGSPIGQYVYQTYNQSDFDKFYAMYAYSNTFFLGIGKPNISRNTHAESTSWPHQVANLYKAKDGSCKYIANLQPQSKEATMYYGAPPNVYITYTVAANTEGKEGVAMELQWMEKPPTRLPEAIFFSFLPKTRASHAWRIHKLGQMIDPMSVIQNGSQTQHGVDRGMYYIDPSSSGLEILSLDVPVATMMTSQSPLSAIPQQLSPLQDMTGVSFNVLNNVWNVNYVFWYPYLIEDMNHKFRFFLSFL